ncbi:substrate binding domain-containing protein [Paenalcaligenes hermetiae]|uniref:LysR substrate-binding domain-containing protein n=1 Tax=Paenalcaligenes hermetiae TaxID=1157987 RepID=A0ABP9M966_9BURK
MACSVSLAQSVLSLLTSEFVQLYPQVRIELLADNKTVNLIEEGVDVALRISNDLDPNQIAIRLEQCHSILCAAPSYLNKNPAITHPSALKQHNCLSYSYFGTTHWLLSKNQQQYKIPVKGSITSNEANVLLFASLNGAGISQQPRYSAQPLIDQVRGKPRRSGRGRIARTAQPSLG